MFFIIEYDYCKLRLQLKMMPQEQDQQVIAFFAQHLQTNRQKAQHKKEEYLQRIMNIFRQFVRKCEAQIDRIIQKKILKLEANYNKLLDYFNDEQSVSTEEKKLIVNQFLVKPFEKFPFSGNKNEKIFKEQYNLIEKASVLIQQTLVDSFNQEQIPNFSNHKFFETIKNQGIGDQSLVKYSISPKKISLQPLEDLTPIQKNIKSLKMMGQYLVLIGDQKYIQIWDLQAKLCIKKLYIDVLAPISCISNLIIEDVSCLAIGFADVNPQIWIYRTDNWAVYSYSRSHTRSVTKIIQAGPWMLSGSIDGNVCLYSLFPFKNIHNCPHISSIQDLIHKNTFVYVLLKCSSICQYEIQQSETEVVFQFRRTLSSGYISMIRFTEVGSNFAGVSCHIYGLSQIQITRKFRVEETNIINVSEMIADFVVVQSKQTSEYFAICGFQNSSAVRIYSLKSGQAIFELSSDYLGQVGVAGYLPKVQIAYINNEYLIMIVNQSQFGTDNTIRVYRLSL